MSDESERARREELAHQLAQAMHSPWEPRCVCAAFATPDPLALHLTMQGWIDLATIRSPLLVGKMPAPGELDAAAAIFGLDLSEHTPAAACDAASGMLRAVNRAFSMRVQMEQPGALDETPEFDGFGDWLPMWAFLVAQCGLSLADAREIRVDQAHALISTHRRNQGWLVVGVSYAARDIEEGGPNV